MRLEYHRPCRESCALALAVVFVLTQIIKGESLGMTGSFIEQSTPWRLEITPSSVSVEKFAELTGDFNPLHVDASFARRSIYRHSVVHGMFPLIFLGKLDIFHRADKHWRLAALSAQFLEPVFVGSTLELTAESMSSGLDRGEASFRYTIKNADSESLLTKGEIRVTSAAVSDRPDCPAVACDGSPEMLLDSLEARELALEDIQCDATDSFSFRISQKSLEALRDITSAASNGGRPDQSRPGEEASIWPDLSALMMISTSSGMCIPGKRGILVELRAEFTKPVCVNTLYTMEGRVRHVSQTTRMLKKHFTIAQQNGAGASVSGDFRAVVNPAPLRMPTMEEIKTPGVDLGLRHKVIVITGASRGIGETTAKLFGLLGAKVIVNYFQGKDDAARITREIVAEGGDAIAIQSDVSDRAAVRDMVRVVVEKYGRIDILVNNAAADYRPIDFLEMSWEDVQKDIDVIVKGAFNCCKEIIPLMLSNGAGKIINISSSATDNPPAGQAKYVTAKSALVGLSRSLAAEFAAKNIQVNLIAPSLVETDFVAHVAEPYRKKLAQDNPMGRNASPLDVARAVVLLASSFATFTTGQRWMVTGGAAPFV
jgi:3-oxoacyl-[acyl-carrier protein] reductase